MDVLDMLETWALALAIRERGEGYAAQMRGERVISATHIGREFAFMLMVAKIQEVRRESRRLHSVRVELLQRLDDDQRRTEEGADQRDYAEERFNARLLREE